MFAACANICNVFLMRNSELSTGVDVEDKDGNVVGTSKVAAYQVHTIRYYQVHTISIGIFVQEDKLIVVFVI